MDRVAFTRNTLRDFVSHLVLWVADDDIILGHQHDKGDLPFAAHGFTAAGRAEHKAVGTAGLLAVQQDLSLIHI